MRKAKKIVGYNVYRAPDGCGESYYGFAKTLDDAKALAASGPSIEEALYDTARAAGHCAGIPAPDKSHEADEVEEWFGDDGYDCAVAVYEATP